MQVHDFHLRGYEVLDFGSTIVLDTVYDYPNEPKRETTVRFEGVELYKFRHTSGAIISDIEPVPLNQVIKRNGNFIRSAAANYGVKGWQSDLEQYADYLVTIGAHGWTVTSSVGFDGFVIARSVREMRA